MALVKWLGYDSRSWIPIKDTKDIKSMEEDFKKYETSYRKYYGENYNKVLNNLKATKKS